MIDTNTLENLELIRLQRELRVANNALTMVRAELSELQNRRLMTLEILGFHIICSISTVTSIESPINTHMLSMYINGHEIQLNISAPKDLLEDPSYVEHLRESVKHDLASQIAHNLLSPTNIDKILSKIGVKT